MTQEQELTRIKNALKQIFSPRGCSCIRDMPGDNYTCTAHQFLWQVARGQVDEKLAKCFD